MKWPEESDGKKKYICAGYMGSVTVSPHGKRRLFKKQDIIRVKKYLSFAAGKEENANTNYGTIYR